MKVRKGLIASLALLITTTLPTAAHADDTIPDGVVVGYGGTAIASSLTAQFGVCTATIVLTFSEAGVDTTPVGVIGKAQATAASTCVGGGAAAELISLHVYVDGADNTGGTGGCVEQCVSGEHEVESGESVRAVSHHRLTRISPATWNLIPPELCNIAPSDSSNDIVCHSEVTLIPAT